jgi:hypothetical protein
MRFGGEISIMKLVAHSRPSGLRASRWAHKENMINKREIKSTIIIFVIFCLLSLIFVILYWRIERYYPILPGIDGISRAALSPDGKLIAYECIYLEKQDIEYQSSASSGPPQQAKQDICIYDITGNNNQRITYEQFMYYPSWSPDGKKLAWMNEYKNIIVWELRTHNWVKYHSSEYLFGSFFEDWDFLEWANDGINIYLQGSGVTLNTHTGEFTFSSERDRNIPSCCYSISPNGKYLAVIEKYSEIRNDYRLRIYENHELIFESIEYALHNKTAWSSDSTMIAWVSTSIINISTPQSHYHSESLLVTDIISKKTIKIKINLNKYDYISNPSWTKGDERLSFASYNKIYWVDIEINGEPFNITTLDIGIIKDNYVWNRDPLSWSLNGELVVYKHSVNNFSIASTKNEIITPIKLEQLSDLSINDLLRVLLLSFYMK